MALDIAALKAAAASSANRAPITTGGSGGAGMTLTAEQESGWDEVLPTFPVDESVWLQDGLEALIGTVGDSPESAKYHENRASELAKALRLRYCPSVGGGQGEFQPVWVSGYAEHDGAKPEERVYTGRVRIAVRSAIPANGGPVKKGTHNPDGTRKTA